MSPFDLVYAHPIWTCIVLLAAGKALASVVAAAVAPLATRCRPGDCPRCGGTGRDPL